MLQHSEHSRRRLRCAFKLNGAGSRAFGTGPPSPPAPAAGARALDADSAATRNLARARGPAPAARGAADSDDSELVQVEGRRTWRARRLPGPARRGRRPPPRRRRPIDGGVNGSGGGSGRRPRREWPQAAAPLCWPLREQAPSLAHQPEPQAGALIRRATPPLQVLSGAPCSPMSLLTLQPASRRPEA